MQRNKQRTGDWTTGHRKGKNEMPEGRGESDKNTETRRNILMSAQAEEGIKEKK